MNIDDDLSRAQSAVRGLESAVRGLRAHLGPHIDLLRLADDVNRCAIDLSRLEGQAAAQPRATLQDVIVIPDGDYDSSLWADGDVDSEGLGATAR